MTNDRESDDFILDNALKKLTEEHRPELPSPGLIWFRAQVVRKFHQKKKVEQPVVVMCGLVSLASVMFLANFVAGNWGPIQDAWKQVSWFVLPTLFVTIAALAASWALVRKSSTGR
jgi:hypothetical protein